MAVGTNQPDVASDFALLAERAFIAVAHGRTLGSWGGDIHTTFSGPLIHVPGFQP